MSAPLQPAKHGFQPFLIISRKGVIQSIQSIVRFPQFLHGSQKGMYGGLPCAVFGAENVQTIVKLQGVIQESAEIFQFYL